MSDLVMDFIVRLMVHHWLMIAAVMVMVDLVNLERSWMVILVMDRSMVMEGSVVRGSKKVSIMDYWSWVRVMFLMN